MLGKSSVYSAATTDGHRGEPHAKPERKGSRFGAQLDGLGKEPTLAALGHVMQRVPLTREDVARMSGRRRRATTASRSLYGMRMTCW